MHMRCLWSQQRCWGLLHTYQPHPAAPASADACACLLCRGPTYDLNRIPGPWRTAKPVVGNVLECLRPDFHRVVLGWADKYGGIVRVKFLWRDALVVTDPAALAVIMGRGEGALDKAAGVYSPINYMCDPHGQPNLLTSAADGQWKAIRKAVAVSFSIQNIKKKYPLVLGKVNQLLGRLAAQGSCTAVDVDQAALRVTLDVIGLVSGGIWGAGGGGGVGRRKRVAPNVEAAAAHRVPGVTSMLRLQLLCRQSLQGPQAPPASHATASSSGRRRGMQLSGQFFKLCTQ